MVVRFVLAATFVLGLAFPSFAQDKPDSKPVTKPIELEVLKSSVGIWDAEAEVWPQGLNSPSTKFKGVETNQLYGEYWISSDSEYDGMKLHSIMGYDLDRKKMVGTVIDHGPYAATLTGEYDKNSKTVTWMTNVKDVSGKPLVQKTTIEHKNENERVLVMYVPGEKENEFVKIMKIKFVKREK